MQTFAVKDDFPPLFYVEFTLVVVAFGRLEYLIKRCVKDLFAEGFTKGMAEAESQYQFDKICKKAKCRAAKKLSQTQAQYFSELIDRAAVLAAFRNDNVHAAWTTDNGMPLRIRPKWDRDTRSVDWSGNRAVPVSELQMLRKKIEALYQEIEAQRQTWQICA